VPDSISNQKPNLSLVIRQAFYNLLKEVHTTIPGKIVSFDPETQSAQVQASIRRIYVTKDSVAGETQTPVDIPTFINVPVIFLRGGGWCITFPVKTDDECIIHFSERAIDTWRKNGDIQDPKDWRMHNYSDAICQVGLSSEANLISDFDNENFQVRNEDGDVSVTLSKDKEVKVDTPVKVIVTAPEQEFEASTSMNFNTPIATFTQDVQIDGTSNADGDHVSAGISGKGHKHDGSPTAGTGPVSDTGGPK